MVCVLGDRITKSLPYTAFGNAFLYFKAIFFPLQSAANNNTKLRNGAAFCMVIF